jgi:transglutaminase-like putative cysteine protease
MKKLVLPLLLICCYFTAYSQQDYAWQQTKEKFPDAPAIFVERSEVLNLEIINDSLSAYADIFEDILYLKEQGDVFSSRKVYGSHFNQISNLKAKTLIWEKSKYRELKVSSFKKNSDPSDGIFFDDQYHYSFNFPSIAAQNRTHLSYRENIKDTRFISGYVFANYLPQSNVRYIIKAPKDVEIGYTVFNDEKGVIKFKRSEKGNVATYEWSVENFPGIKIESNAPDIRYYAPHVVSYVKSFKKKDGQTINILSNLNDLYSWYNTFIKDLNKNPSPQLQAVVDKIKLESKSEVDLVKNVFYWVQDNIKYIAFEQGMRGFVPHNAEYVCEKRYGDCKDMANIIVGILQLADVKAYHTWIGTRDIPYKYTTLPTPMVDNHMIATYIDPAGRHYFLDATSDYTPFGYPSSMIQGKEALIALNASEYKIFEVPTIERVKNYMIDSVSIRLESNQVIGSGKSTLDGFSKVFAAYEFDRTNKDDIDKSAVRLLGKGSNKFFLDHYNITHLQNRDLPTIVNYNFRIIDYFQRVGDEIYINLHLSKDYYNDFLNKDTRTTPKEAKFHYTASDVIEFKIPEGYEPEYIPKNITHEGTLLGFKVTYKVESGSIILTREIFSKYLLMNVSDFDSWNESVKKISEVYKESIILKKK